MWVRLVKVVSPNESMRSAWDLRSADGLSAAVQEARIGRTGRGAWLVCNSSAKVEWSRMESFWLVR